MKSFVLMLTFLTRIPFPVRFEFNEKDFARGLVHMPVIGLILALPMYLVAAYVPFPSQGMKAFILMLMYLMVAGGLHLDGLADYFDGVFSARDRQRVLEIMKDSSLGTFGVVGLILWGLGMYTGLTLATPLTILLMPVVGRVVGMMLCAFGKYPKEAGMGQPLVAYGQWYHGFLACLLLLAVLLWLGPTYGLSGLVVLGAMVLFFLRTNQVIGGITGDVVGAGIEISQILWLLIQLSNLY